MDASATSSAALAQRWDATYRERGIDGVSWFQATPVRSLQLIDLLGISPDGAVIDVGGGASTLVDRLVKRGFVDISILDISQAALEAAQRRVGTDAPVCWLRDDLLAWRPERRFDLWHDRAVFHFLVEPRDRDRYLTTLRSALTPGGAIIIATFAPDGPDHCSGLPVARYSGDDLAKRLGSSFHVIDSGREEHTTPTGGRQPFTWVAARDAA
jgi:SAM-dependent methyltransferase